MEMQPEGRATIYTIGHSNVPVRRIVELLKKYEIQVLVDVRSSPYSKHVSQFNREMLASALNQEGIDYKFAGDYLGGRPKDPTCYINGQIPEGHADFLHIVDYSAVMTKDWYQKGISRLLQIASKQRAAVMCSEEDPARCHRQHLISQTLLKDGIEVLHIRHKGDPIPAWLLPEETIEKQEEKPVEQLDLLSIIKPQEEVLPAHTVEYELEYEPIDDTGMSSLFPDFLTDELPVKKTKQEAKKAKQPGNDKRQQAEKERLLKWIEQAKRNGETKP